MASAFQPGLSGSAFVTLLWVAPMMGGNHVAARIAFKHGVDVAPVMWLGLRKR